MTTMLEKFGLTSTEEKVYLALLRIRSSPASGLIKKTQLHRTTVYDVLDRLIGKGLVSFVFQNKIKYYIASKPSKFLDIAKEERQLADDKQKLALEVASKLSRVGKEPDEKPLAKIFVGEKGVRTLMDDIILTRKDFTSFGSAGRFLDLVPEHYAHQWAKQRRKHNIGARLIGVTGTRAPKFELNKFRTLPKKYFAPVSTLIYGNKVAVILKENPTHIILIESKKLALGYEKYFELLWGLARNSCEFTSTSPKNHFY